jgi:7-cyano-7-deazaguanine synthase
MAGSKIVVVLSGGMDSATALAWAIGAYGRDNVLTLTFNYGSKHNERENACAAALARYYRVPNRLVHLPLDGLFKSDLLKSGGDIPDGHYADPSMKRTVVPFRNGIMLAIAAGYAESEGATALILGNHAGDHAIYPDCREEFTVPMSVAIEAGTYARITIKRPFEQITKTGIAELGARLGVPYDLTWSCYKGGESHCGTCGTCHERREAFRDSGVPDPTTYTPPRHRDAEGELDPRHGKDECASPYCQAAKE